MKQITAVGRIFYAVGLIAIGIQQILMKDFRPEILPPFPSWAHHYSIFPIVVGILLIFSGIIVSGLIRIQGIDPVNVCLYLGFFFIAIIITCQLPYLFFYSPDKLSQLGVWDAAGEELAYGGGAFVLAGSFIDVGSAVKKKGSFTASLEKLIPFGRIFFAVLMLIFGISHFVYTDYVLTLIPKWCGFPLFWAYACGVLLIGATISIVFKIWIRQVAFLLGLMLFLWFIFVHIPLAIANGSASYASETVRAIICVLFSGIALVISTTNLPSARNAPVQLNMV